MAAAAPRIVYIGPLPHKPVIGGMGHAAGQLLRGLAARGYPIRTLTARTPDDATPHPFAKRHPEIVVHYYDVGHDVHLQRSLENFEQQSARIAAMLPGLLDAWRPDLLLVISPAFFKGVRTVAQRYALPWIVWMHAIVEPAVAGEPRYPEELVPRIRRHMGDADVIVAVAEHYARLLRSWGLARVETIPNGIDLERFAPDMQDPSLRLALGIAVDDIVVAHLSNLQPLKRGLDLVASAALALPQEPRLRYLIIGDGVERARLEAACREHGIAARFRFTGWVEHERVPDYLNLADMVAMPSGSEVMPLAYLETQANAKVLIASDIAAARELINDGETGFLFPLGDVAALAERTLQVAADAALRRRIGAQARAWAERRYDVETKIDRFAALIDDVVAARRGG